MRTTGLAPSLLLSALLSVPADGQDRSSAQTPQERGFQRFDKNGDGVITLREAPSRAAFERADGDGDGRVTREEFAQRARRRGAQRQAGNLDGTVPKASSQVTTRLGRTQRFNDLSADRIHTLTIQSPRTTACGSSFDGDGARAAASGTLFRRNINSH